MQLWGILMFARFTVKAEQTFEVRINPDHVTSFFGIGPEKTKVVSICGTEHVLTDPIDDVANRLERARGCVLI
jgi:hypothetical protein